MNARNIQMGTIIDTIAWIKSTLFVVLGTERGSPERRAKLDELARAVVRARELADAYQGSLAVELKLALRVAEMALARFKIEPPIASSEQAQGDPRGRPPRPSSSTSRRRVHPRRLARATS